MITKTIAYKLEHDEPILRFAYIIYGPFKGYNVELLEKQKKAAFRKLSNGKTEYRQEIWFNVRIETSNITELVDPRILVNTEKNVLGYENPRFHSDHRNPSNEKKGPQEMEYEIEYSGYVSDKYSSSKSDKYSSSDTGKSSNSFKISSGPIDDIEYKQSYNPRHREYYNDDANLLNGRSILERIIKIAALIGLPDTEEFAKTHEKPIIDILKDIDDVESKEIKLFIIAYFFILINTTGYQQITHRTIVDSGEHEKLGNSTPHYIIWVIEKYENRKDKYNKRKFRIDHTRLENYIKYILTKFKIKLNTQERKYTKKTTIKRVGKKTKIPPINTTVIRTRNTYLGMHELDTLINQKTKEHIILKIEEFNMHHGDTISDNIRTDLFSFINKLEKQKTRSELSAIFKEFSKNAFVTRYINEYRSLIEFLNKRYVIRDLEKYNRKHNITKKIDDDIIHNMDKMSLKTDILDILDFHVKQNRIAVSKNILPVNVFDPRKLSPINKGKHSASEYLEIWNDRAEELGKRLEAYTTINKIRRNKLIDNADMKIINTSKEQMLEYLKGRNPNIDYYHAENIVDYISNIKPSAYTELLIRLKGARGDELNRLSGLKEMYSKYKEIFKINKTIFTNELAKNIYIINKIQGNSRKEMLEERERAREEIGNYHKIRYSQ